MFDIGFSELLLVALVALLVFGPERLPGAVRTGSLWLGRLKRSVQSIKQEVEREIGADEIRRQLHNEEILHMERELKQSLQTTPPGSDTKTQAAADEPKAQGPASASGAPAETPPPPRQP
jgi:sec-independent protein translocase protein TatB